MSSGSVARRYARAVFALAEEQGSLDRTAREMNDLADAISSSADLQSALTNPAFGTAERRQILTAVLGKLGASNTVKNLSLLLLDRDRVSEAPMIARELGAMVDAKIGRIHATVTSAAKLSSEQSAKLKAELEKLSGRTVEMEMSEDPALLGGVVAKVGDLIYDGSLRTQLSLMKDQLSS